MPAQLMKIVGSTALLSLLVVAAAVMAYHLLREPARPRQVRKPPAATMPVPHPPPQAAVSTHRTPPAPALPAPAPPAPAPSFPTATAPTPAPASRPTYEVFPRREIPERQPAGRVVTPAGRLPAVAIIIDDIGYDRRVATELLTLDAPLTFSVLPFGTFSRQILAEARAKGHEIMLHLPMEPNEYPHENPGPGALLFRMVPDELISQLNTDLDQFSDIKGVNNHMGSALSTSPEIMRQIFTVLKKRGLFYIDSRTTSHTAARLSAEKLQVPFAERDIFLDHDQDPAAIRKQLDRLIACARRQGYAVAIGHPHPETFQALLEYLPKLKQDVELVPASEVVQAEEYAQASGSGIQSPKADLNDIRIR